MNVVVVGCGSLGGVIAGKLANKHRNEITVLSRNKRINDSILERGIIVRHADKRHREIISKVNVIYSHEELNFDIDIAIITTKINSLFDAAFQLLPHMSENGRIVTVQNGLAGLELREKIGASRVFITSVLWGASMIEPGVYEVTANGPFVCERPTDNFETQIVKLLGNVFPVKTVKSIKGVLWAKLSINASLTTLGAITGLPFGRLLDNKKARGLSLTIGSEIRTIAEKEGVKLSKLPGGLNVEFLLGRPVIGRFNLPQFFRHFLIRLIGKKHGKTESSMLASVLRGRKTEIDYLNGLIVHLGEKHGIPTPINRRVVELVKKLEKGEIKPTPSNLDSI